MDRSTLKNVKTEAVVHAAQVRNQIATGTGVLRPSTVWSHKGAGRPGLKQLKRRVYMPCALMWLCSQEVHTCTEEP